MHHFIIFIKLFSNLLQQEKFIHPLLQTDSSKPLNFINLNSFWVVTISITKESGKKDIQEVYNHVK